MLTHGDASECYSIYIRYGRDEKVASTRFWNISERITRGECFGWMADFR